jgi:hypothetical protein
MIKNAHSNSVNQIRYIHIEKRKIFAPCELSWFFLTDVYFSDWSTPEIAFKFPSSDFRRHFYERTIERVGSQKTLDSNTLAVDCPKSKNILNEGRCSTVRNTGYDFRKPWYGTMSKK